MIAALVALIVLADPAGISVAFAEPKPDVPEGAPPVLSVRGAKLVDPAGEVVRLIGLNIPSLEWSNEGEHVLRSLEVAIDDWRANCIRIPLSQDRWFGSAPGQTDDGRAYRKLVEEMVSRSASKSTYVVLDLHWSNAGVWGQNIGQQKMPDEGSAIFWKDLARRFGNHPAVMFDLYNEPRDVSWEVWREGGTLPEGYRTPGMQALVDLVRNSGSKNIVWVGGLDWAYDLRGVLQGFAIAGENVGYSSHVYPWKRDWEGQFGVVARKYPVLVGEVGCELDPKQEDPYSWGPRILRYLDELEVSVTAWCFHPSASPRMLKDWSYEPTPYWGAQVKAWMLGRPAPWRIRTSETETQPHPDAGR